MPAMWSHILLWMQTLTSREPCEAGALELSDVSVMGILAHMAHDAWMGAEHTAQSQLHGSFQVRISAKPVPSALCRQHAYAACLTDWQQCHLVKPAWVSSVTQLRYVC